MNCLVSAAFDYEAHFCQVLGSTMHYIEEGEGEVMLFLHGIPTSCYLWRNVIPYMSSDARCIGLDLIGMGRSDKPAIDYTVFDHIRYVEAFIEAMGIERFSLVMHGWGSVIGSHLAMKYPEKISGLAFIESHLRAADNWEAVALPVKQLVDKFDHSAANYHQLVEENDFINQILPQGVMRRLTEEEMDAYRAPFITIDSRKPIWQYLHDFPMGDETDESVLALIRDYAERLRQSQVPKLLMYAVPGFNTTMDTVNYAKNCLLNVRVVCIGDGLHYPQESDPDSIGLALYNWYGDCCQ